MTTAPESNQPDLVSTADEVLAALPETIVQVDPDERIFHVNRVESPVFSRRVSRGDRLEDVIVPEAIEALAGILDNVEFTGGALAEFRTAATFSEVGQRLGVAHTTVSRKIRELEDHFGARLV